MTTVVFLGPSLDLTEARTILPDAIFLPPARQASVVTALSIYHPQVIGLIDGVFGQSFAVWHKELLLALERGVRVLGASSMGALRAAELEPFGMVGVGEIYRRYSSGELEDDDEVAVTHAGEELAFRPLSEAMVNLRATFDLAAERGVVTRDAAAQLLQIAKRLYFPERTLAMLFELARRELAEDVIDAARDFAREHYVDLKGADARLLLETLRDATDIPRPEDPPTAARSLGFNLAYHLDRCVHREDADVPLRNVAAWAALHEPQFDSLNFAALNRALVQVLSEMLGVEASAEQVGAEFERFRTERNLESDADLEDWLHTNDLDMDELQDLLRQLAACRYLQHWLLATRRGLLSTRWILDELRLHGRYPHAADSAAQQLTVAGDVAEIGELPELLHAFRRATDWRPPSAIGVWAEEAGFTSPADLELELTAALRVRAQFAEILETLHVSHNLSREEGVVHS
jgi:hypothetical protein